MQQYLDSPIRGHSGMHATYAGLKKHFYWVGMLKDVMAWIQNRYKCVRCKSEHYAYPGLLQPLANAT